jgi:hypothetical protein
LRFSSRLPSRYYAVTTPISVHSAKAASQHQKPHDPAWSGTPVPYGPQSDCVVIFLERLLDMFQKRFGIGIRYFGLFAVLNSQPAATRLAIPGKPGLEFGLDAIPVAIAHHRPSAPCLMS